MSDAHAIAALLKSTGFFAQLEADDLSACATRFNELRFAAGQVVFARGEPGNSLYLLAEGRVRLAFTSTEGRELSVRIAGPGELFGEISVLDGALRTADATAVTAARLYALPAVDFDQLLDAHPPLARAVIRFLCQRLRQTTDQLEGIALYPIESRLARFLTVALAGRTAAPGKRIPLELGFSQTELAQLLGASRPKVNVALGALEEAGAIKRTSDRLFCDPVILARIAEAADA